MEMISTLLALYERNPTDTCCSTHKAPVIQSFDVSFVASPNQLLNKQSSYWWFVLPWSGVTVMCVYSGGTVGFSWYVKQRFFQGVKMWNQQKIDVKSWLAIPVMIAQFWTNVDIYFVISFFHGLYLGIYDTKSWNRPFYGVKMWNAPYISHENVH